jgi:hypothetical protein
MTTWEARKSNLELGNHIQHLLKNKHRDKPSALWPTRGPSAEGKRGKRQLRAPSSRSFSTLLTPPPSLPRFVDCSLSTALRCWPEGSRMITNWLTKWSWELLEKTKIAKLLKIFTKCYGPSRSIYIYTRPVIGAYSKPDESNVYRAILFLLPTSRSSQWPLSLRLSHSLTRVT